MNHERSPGSLTLRRYERDARRLVAMFSAIHPSDESHWPAILGSPGFIQWARMYLDALTSRATVRRYRAALVAVARTQLGDAPDLLVDASTGRERPITQSSASAPLSGEQWKTIEHNIRHYRWDGRSDWGARAARLLRLTLLTGVLPAEWVNASIRHTVRGRMLSIPAEPPRGNARVLDISALDPDTEAQIQEILQLRDHLGPEEWRAQVNRVPWHLRHAAARLWPEERPRATLHAAREHFARQLMTAGWKAEDVAKALGLVRLPAKWRQSQQPCTEIPIIKISLGYVPGLHFADNHYATRNA